MDANQGTQCPILHAKSDQAGGDQVRERALGVWKSVVIVRPLTCVTRVTNESGWPYSEPHFAGIRRILFQ
jgi:hypothetical protein